MRHGEAVPAAVARKAICMDECSARLGCNRQALGLQKHQQGFSEQDVIAVVQFVALDAAGLI